MRSEEFQAHLNRLSGQFKNAYGTERAKLVWNEVKDFDARWFSDLVDQFIGELAHAPLLPAFREAAAKERERLYKIRAQREEREAKNVMSGGSIQGDDAKTVFGMLIKRMNNELSDEDFVQCQKMLSGVADSGGRGSVLCKTCDDSGLAYTTDGAYEFGWRCFCLKGQQDTRNFPTIGRN